MFQIAERLHQPVTVIEAMSRREVQAWIDYWSEPVAAPAADDDALDLASLSKQDLRSMFPGRP
jgi:hypothetical protein